MVVSPEQINESYQNWNKIADNKNWLEQLTKISTNDNEMEEMARNQTANERNSPETEDNATESRYQRQASLLQNQGWDQTKLERAKVAVIGSEALANYAALTLTAFGFGNIEIYSEGKLDSARFQNHKNVGEPDFSQGFLNYESSEMQDQTIAKSLESILKKINPSLNIKGINLGMQRKENTEILQKPSIIIEATNDPASKISILDYAIINNIPVVSMSAGKNKGGVGLYVPQANNNSQQFIENLLFHDMQEEKQDPIISQVIAGLGIEEARKIINPMTGEKTIEDLLIYNMQSDNRFDHTINKRITAEVDLKDYSICLIGAGALGNFVGLGLALRNIGKLTVVDFDTTEIHNLNRQILLYEGVGQEKAKALVQKLKQINPRGNYTAKIEKIIPESSDYFRRNNFDMIIDTVDNNKTRALLNYFSLKHNIPFISGGTRYNSGQVNICVPEKTGCLNCQADIDKLALGNYNRERQSCIYAAQPSVITSNQITAGLIVLEIPNVLDNNNFGDLARGEIKFVSNEEFRLALLPSAVPKCGCYKNKELMDGWLEKMKGVYD